MSSVPGGLRAAVADGLKNRALVGPDLSGRCRRETGTCGPARGQEGTQRQVWREILALAALVRSINGEWHFEPGIAFAEPAARTESAPTATAMRAPCGSGFSRDGPSGSTDRGQSPLPQRRRCAFPVGAASAAMAVPDQRIADRVRSHGSLVDPAFLRDLRDLRVSA